MANSFVDKLLHEHNRMRKLLSSMQKQVAIAESGGSPDMESFGFALDYLRNFPTAIHHPKEDLMYYQMIQRAPSFGKEFHCMLAQHRHIHQLEAKLADAAAQVIRSRIQSYRQLADYTHEYAHLQQQHRDGEERFLFPYAERLLTPEDWEYLASPSDHMRTPLFAPGEIRRFESLFVYLARPPCSDGAASASAA